MNTSALARRILRVLTILYYKNFTHIQKYMKKVLIQKFKNIIQLSVDARTLNLYITYYKK